MKSLLKMLFSILLVTAFASCEPEEPVEEPLKPTIEVSSNFTDIAYGDSCILTVTVANTTSVSSELGTVNVVTNTFQITTPKLTQTTTYRFVAHGEKSLVVGTNITINVKPLPIAPTVTLTAVPTTVLLGNSASIRISKGGDITKTLVNGVVYEGNYYTTQPLYEDTKFVVEVFGVNHDSDNTTSNYAKDSVVVKVDILSSYLLQNHWYLTLMEGIDPYTGVWVKYYNECTYSDTTYFRNDGTFERFRVCDPSNPYHSIGGGYWSFQDNQTVLNMGSTFDILELNQDTLRLLKKSGLVRITYSSKRN